MIYIERARCPLKERHRAIVDAIQLRNPMLAEAEMIKHLSYVTEKMKGIKNF